MTTGSHRGVVDLLDEEWEALVQLNLELTEAEWDMPSECPGWRVRDVLAHVVGTERTLLGDPPPPAPGELLPHVRNETGARNEAWVQSRRSASGAALVEEFAAVTARRLEQLRSWPAERFEARGPSPVGEVPYTEFMRVRVMDCWVHEQDMRVATGRPGHDAGPVARLALSRIASAMPFVVGKQAGAPEGSVVRFELRGPEAQRLDVAVRGGRGALVDVFDGSPTTVLAMGTEAFWRLGCGRVQGAAARAAGLVAVGGDEILGARVVDAMAFMI